MTKRNVFRYWGGKLAICDWVISHFPRDYEMLNYIEPFCGSAVVLLNKLPSKKEIISDTDQNLFNVYRALKEQPNELKRMLDNTLYSNNELNYAVDILEGKFKDVNWMLIAWAKIVSLNISILGLGKRDALHVSIDDANRPSIFKDNINRVSEVCSRLKNVYVLCRDALKVIDQFDSPKSFFYLDPPYPDTNQSGYKDKYTIDDFNKLTERLMTIEGKYLVSFELKEGMECKYQMHGRRFYFKEITRGSKSGINKSDKQDKSRECLMCNYDNELNKQIRMDDL